MALIIEPLFQSSWTGNSDAVNFTAVVEQLISDWSALFLCSARIPIKFSYGATAGSSIAQTALSFGSTYSYASMVSMMKTFPTDAIKDAAFSTLPGSDPGWGSGLYQMPVSLDAIFNSKRVAVASCPSITVNNTVSFDTTVDGSSCDPAKYSLYRVLMLELSEATGKQSYLFNSTASPLDFFSFTAASTRSFTGTDARYFSIDNGVTNLAPYQHGAFTGDFGNWDTGVVSPFCTFSSTGDHPVLQPFDIQLMSALGIGLSEAGQRAAGITTLATRPNGVLGF